MAVAISQFGGIIPRESWYDLPAQNATIAHNVKLRNGKLEPWRERKAIAASVADAVSVFFHGCCAYTWDTCVYATDYVADFERMFLTGRVSYPETGKYGNNCSITYYRLGVPQPTTILEVSGTLATGRDCAARSYCYTYVNVFGEEGAPSYTSDSITVEDGTAVTLSNFNLDVAEEYGIVGINIYRTATAYRTGQEKEQTPLTEFLLVASIDLSSATFTDTVLEKNLGTALVTEDAREPPENIRQIRYLHGTGVLAGVTVNQVHFSVPYQPSNWKAEYDLTLPYNIVNSVAVGDKLIVSTDGYPYVINGAPSCEPKQCRSVTEINTPLPDIGCGHVNSAISTPFGMVYSSKDGLVLVAPNATFQIITSAWFSTDDWVKLRPETVRLAYWRGYIVCVTDVLSFMLEIDAKTYNDSLTSNLTTISDKPVCMTLTQSGELIMLEDDILWQWNAGDKYRAYQWDSRELSLGGESTPLVAKVRTNGITLTVVSHDDREYSRYVPHEQPVRLQRLGRDLNWRVRFTGTGTVEYAGFGMTFNVFKGANLNGNKI